MNDATPIRPTRNVELGASDEPFQNLHEFIRKARVNVNQNAWDYIVGAAETETTMRRNRMALDEIAFRPRVLRDVSKVDASAERFGRKLRLPVMMAPVGALEIFDPAGAAAVTRAAGKFGAAHMLSSVSDPGLEKVAEAAPDALRLYQLYVRGDKEWVDSTIKRALEFGYRAICLTVDRAAYGRRERDLAKGHRPTARVGHASETFQAAFNWDDVDRIRSYVNVPLVLKGISTAEDAEIGVARGVDGIYVSNHGGRQLDHSQGTISALPGIVAAVGGRAEIIVDGGILRGTDVLKALALGATAVGIGRLQGIALGAGGEDAVVRMLEIVENEIVRSMTLLGVTKIAELNKTYLTPAEPLARTWLESAFPLMREGYGRPASEIRDLSLALPGDGTAR